MSHLVEPAGIGPATESLQPSVLPLNYGSLETEAGFSPAFSDFADRRVFLCHSVVGGTAMNCTWIRWFLNIPRHTSATHSPFELRFLYGAP